MNALEIVWTEEARADWHDLDPERKEQVRRLIAYIKMARGGGWFWGYTAEGRRLWYVSSEAAQVIFYMNYHRQRDQAIIVGLGTAYVPPLEERD